MGLDMYLTAETFVSGYDHNKDGNFQKVLDLLNISALDVERSLTIDLTIGYWRKANAIHNWFVENVQDGEDKCQRSYVSVEQLKDLRDECALALKEFNKGDLDKADSILPPKSGFFFGSTALDEGYKHDLEDTIKIIDRCLSDKFKNYTFHYQASW